MAVAWEAVRAALVARLPGVVGPSVVVYDGPSRTGEAPTAFVTVGHAPSSVEGAAGTFTQDVGPDGYSAAESGVVVCELAAVTGSTEVPSVFATFDLIASFLQRDMTLGGVLSPASTVTVDATVVAAQTTSGAVQRLIFNVRYFTRI